MSTLHSAHVHNADIKDERNLEASFSQQYFNDSECNIFQCNLTFLDIEIHLLYFFVSNLSNKSVNW